MLEQLQLFSITLTDKETMFVLKGLRINKMNSEMYKFILTNENRMI